MACREGLGEESRKLIHSFLPYARSWTFNFGWRPKIWKIEQGPREGHGLPVGLDGPGDPGQS